MLTFANQRTFTSALTLFCIIIFLYFFIPESLSTLIAAIKYVIIVSTIIVLMMYYKILDGNPNSKENNDLEKEVKNDLFAIEIQSSNTKELYKDLTSIVINTANSINTHSKSAIYITDPSNNCYTLQDGESSLFSDSIAIDNSVVNRFLHNKKKFHHKDSTDEWDSLFIGRVWRGSECSFFSPIELNGIIVGFILTYIDHFNKINQNDINLIGLVSNYVSYGLKNLDSLEKYMFGEETKMLILDILSHIDFKSESQNIFNQYKFLIRNLFQYDRITISLRKESENRRKYDKSINSIIKLVDGYEDEFIEGVDFPTNGSLHGLPTITGDVFTTTNWRESHNNMFRFKSSESEDYKFKSVMGVPIKIEGENRGSIILEKYNQTAFLNRDLEELKLIAQVLGSSLQWKFAYEKIHKNATHDGLSGLLNHQTFKERFTDEIRRAARFQQKMAVMMFDLDKFKNVNDTLGHQYGDYVIQTVAKIMIDNVRAVDVVARYGGEEFAIILINTTADMSNIVARRIVNNIADYEFNLDGVETRLTISGGMSEYPSHSEEMKQLIEIADQEMYATKKRGGNGITIHKQVMKNEN
ncbi:MAG: diguanylate cyclase [Candidatus Neomarinimicrobiota bacterium]